MLALVDWRVRVLAGLKIVIYGDPRLGPETRKLSPKKINSVYRLSAPA